MGGPWTVAEHATGGAARAGQDSHLHDFRRSKFGAVAPVRGAVRAADPELRRDGGGRVGRIGAGRGIWQNQYDGQANILRYRAFADADEDGDLDLDDWASFGVCLGGPDTGGLTPDCYVYDFEPDNDVDLVDFAAMQARFTGP